MAEKHNIIPVWFFVGVILFIDGVLILATGIFQYNNPPPTVLSNLHPALWWGIFTTLFGGFFAITFRPKKE